MRVLVVGSNGFLGAEIAKKLVLAGFEVKGMNRTQGSSKNFQQFRGDVLRSDTYSDYIAKWQPKIVIHAAWVTELQTYRNSRTNYEYSRSIGKFAELCYKSGTEHFIALGSCAEYGETEQPCNASLTNAIPVDVYGKSKLEALHLLERASAIHSGRFTWGRVFQPYGLNQDSHRLIPFLVRELKSGGLIELRNPKVVLDWITSRDVASAILFAIKGDLTPIIDIGTSVGYSVFELVDLLARTMGVKPRIDFDDPMSLPSKDSVSRSLVVSSESPLLLAGWTPGDNLESGLTWIISQ